MLRTYTREFGKAIYATYKGGGTCQGACRGCAEQQAAAAPEGICDEARSTSYAHHQAAATVTAEAANVLELFSAPFEDAWEDVRLSARVRIHACNVHARTEANLIASIRYLGRNKNLKLPSFWPADWLP